MVSNRLDSYLCTYQSSLRGRQIAYNDSGEADEYIADLDQQNKIIWLKIIPHFHD